MREPLNKIEMSEINDDTRRAFLALVGLANLPIQVVEVCDRLVLSTKKFRGASVLSRLLPLRTSELGDLTQNDTFKTLLVSHSNNELYRHPSLPSVSLWEELFPAPWAQLVLLFRPQSGISIQAFPRQFESNLRELWQIFERLEEVLKQNELTCVCFCQKEFSLPVLFHYVRGRRVQVKALGNFESAPHAVPSRQKQLETTLGKRPEWFEIEIVPTDEPLAHLLHQLELLVSDAESSLNSTESATFLEPVTPPYPFPI